MLHVSPILHGSKNPHQYSGITAVILSNGNLLNPFAVPCVHFAALRLVRSTASQSARHSLLRLCFAKLLALLVGGPDDATACAPYGARPVASGNLTTSSQVHLVAGASCAHPTRRLWRGRISWRCGDWEFGRRSSKSPKLQVSQQRKQQKHLFAYTA